MLKIGVPFLLLLVAVVLFFGGAVEFYLEFFHGSFTSPFGNPSLLRYVIDRDRLPSTASVDP